MWRSVGCGKGLAWERGNSTTRTDNMTWLVDRMKNNTITWCTDGSYHRKHAHKISGAGWMMYCTKTGNSMTGKFYEISEDAASYRGEQIGLCVIHHLIVVLCEFCNIRDWHTIINCFNEGAIKMFKRNLRKVWPGCSCADILRNLRDTRKI